MAEDFIVKGLEQFKRVAEVLREEGSGSAGIDKGVKKQLASELRKAGIPLREKIRQAYREEMPHEGGLNEWLAGAAVTVRNRFSASSAGTTLVISKKGHDLQSIEEGKLRHPVYGNRGTWVDQEVPAGVAGKAFDEMAPEISERMDAAVEKVIAEIEAAT